MVRPDKIQGILANLQSYVEKLKILAAFSSYEFLTDFTKVESAKHLLQVAIECCLDVSHHLIASERWRSPKSYAESFEILSERGVFPPEFLPNLLQMARFRNRLVHLYWEVEAETVFDILQTNLGDFEQFIHFILDFVAKNDMIRPVCEK